MIEPKARSSRSDVTKAALIRAAQKCFSAESYPHVTIRTIAQEAECNSAMISRYFGSKEGLFAAAIVGFMLAPEQPSIDAHIASRLAWLTGKRKRPDFDPAMAVYLSAGMSPAKEMMKDAINQQMSVDRSMAEGSDNPQLRVEIANAIFFGVYALRNVIKTEGLSAAGPDALMAVLHPVISELLAPRPARQAKKT